MPNLTPIGRFLSDPEFQSLDYEGQMNAITGYYDEAERQYGWSDTLSSRAGAARKRAEAIVERGQMERGVFEALPPSKRRSQEDSDYLRDAVMNRYAAHGSGSDAMTDWDLPPDDLTDEEIHQYAQAVKNNRPIGPLFPSDMQRVQERAQSMTQSPAYQHYGQVDAEPGDAGARPETGTFKVNRQPGYRGKLDSIFQSLERMYEKTNFLYEAENWQPVGSKEDPVFEVKRKLIANKDNAFEVRFEDGSTRDIELEGSEMDYYTLGEFAAMHRSKFSDEKWKQFEAAMGDYKVGGGEAFLKAVGRGGGTTMSNIGRFFVGISNKLAESNPALLIPRKLGFDPQEVLDPGDQNLQNVQNWSLEQLDSFDRWVDGMWTPSAQYVQDQEGAMKWFERGGEVAGQVALQLAAAYAAPGTGLLAAAPRTVGGAVAVARGAKAAAFSLTGAAPVAGSVYHEALRHHMNNGDDQRVASTKALTESMLAFTSTAALERAGLKYLTGHSKWVNAISKGVRDKGGKLANLAVGAGSGFAGEGFTEGLQAQAESLLQMGVRGDGSRYLADMEAVGEFLDGEFGSILEASFVQEGLLGGVVGGGLGGVGGLNRRASLRSEEAGADEGATVPAPVDAAAEEDAAPPSFHPALDHQVLQSTDNSFWVARVGSGTDVNEFHVKTQGEADRIVQLASDRLALIDAQQEYAKLRPEDINEDNAAAAKKDREALGAINAELDGFAAQQNLPMTPVGIASYSDIGEAKKHALRLSQPGVFSPAESGYSARDILENRLYPRLRAEGKLPSRGTKLNEEQKAVWHNAQVAAADIADSYRKVLRGGVLAPKVLKVRAANQDGTLSDYFRYEVAVTDPATFDQSTTEQSDVVLTAPLGQAIKAPTGNLSVVEEIIDPNTGETLYTSQTGPTSAPQAAPAVAAETEGQDTGTDETPPEGVQKAVATDVTGEDAGVQATDEETDGDNSPTMPYQAGNGNGATQADVESALREIGITETGGVEFVRDPNTDPEGDPWSMHTDGKKVTVNLLTQKSPFQTQQHFLHELGHLASVREEIAGKIDKLTKALTDAERAAVERWASSYPDAEKGYERGAETVRVLSNASPETRTLWEAFMDAIKNFASNFGLADIPRNRAIEIAKAAMRRSMDIVNRPAQSTERRAKANTPIYTPSFQPQAEPEVNVTTPQAQTVRNRISQDLHDNSITGTGDTFSRRMARRFGASAKKLNEVIEPLTSTFGKIDPILAMALRSFENRVLKRGHDWKQKADGFAKGYKAMDKKSRKAMNWYLFNGDWATAAELARMNGFAQGFAEIRPLLDEIYKAYGEVDREPTYLNNYFPRNVKHNRRGEYKAWLRDLEVWDEYDSALKAFNEKNGSIATEEEQMQIANKIISKVVAGKGKPGSLKGRTVPTIAKEALGFYDNADDSLRQYILNAAQDIEAQRFFGHANPDELGRIDATIGGIFAELHRDGVIGPDDLETIRQGIRDRIGAKPVPLGALSFARDIGYMFTIGNAISAITQLGDLGFAAYGNGWYGLGAGEGPVISRDTAYLDRASSEFDKGHPIHEAANNIYEWSQFNRIDGLGKKAIMTGWARKSASMSENAFVDKYEPYSRFLYDREGGMQKVHADLRAGKVTEDVKFLAFAELSNFQPTSMSEMPPTYIRHPGGRIFYMLKSFTIKQFDLMRRDGLAKVWEGSRTGNTSLITEGLTNIVRLGTLMAAAGATADELKQLILGQEVSFRQNVWNSALKLVGLTRYHTDRIKKDEPGAFSDMISSTILDVAVIDLAGKVWDDARDLFEHETFWESVRNSKLVAQAPIAGRLFHYRFGAGSEREQKRIFEELTEPVREASRMAKGAKDALVERQKAGELTRGEKAELDHYKDIDGINIGGLKTAYYAAMREAIKQKDYHEADVLRQALLRLMNDPEQADYERELMEDGRLEFRY